MRWLLNVREVIKSFYERYDRYLNGVIRFAFALCMYLTIMFHAGYSSVLTNPLIAIVMALLSAFLPVASIPAFTCVLLAGEFYSVSLETLFIACLFFAMMLLVYFVFRAGKSWLLALTVLLLLWNMPTALLPMALLISPAEIIVVAFGVLIYGLIIVVKRDVSVLSSQSGSLTMIGRANLLLSDLFSNNRVLILLFALTLIMLFICIMKKSRISYAPLIASIIGGFVFCVVYFIGFLVLSVKMNYALFALSILAFLLFDAVVLFFVLGMDYKRVEYVQFEDDDYFYFVKAVPKRSIAIKEKRVESITGTPEEPSTVGDIDINDLFVHKENEEKREEET